ncbi:DUF2062 domain-containing protein [Marinomonas sp. 15G1-11]|uniref:DUF2062 domain-containing protein n=1 Tax=Marinomonas phaeophyticola TaxID=3004091 RepID=A0ABT4JPD4_9GAMM|nr:DUF2062 domain-containing protein [Marinomonas sp. 15G1-11]MCZ2720219.1 DUF2062 domain-containing protein [Marinomonas sp. 15G1-11]
MPKRYFKKFIPNPERLKSNKTLAILGSQIYDQDLWHLSRRSVAKAFFVGIFWACIPMPFQMLAAVLCAVPFRANVPLSVALVWITNPITMPFVFYGNYLVGSLFVGTHTNKHFQLSVEWIWDKMEHIWLPLYVGSITTGLAIGLLAYIATMVIWKLHVVKRWKLRRIRKEKNKGA